MTINPAVAAAIAAAKQAEDQSKVQTGGTGYTPAAAGKCYGRLISYLELGKENYEYEGKPKTKDRVRLVFELIGKKHPPTEVTIDGVTTLVPVRVTVNVNKSFGRNGRWLPLFAALNYDKDITHAAEAVGRAYALEIVHNTDKKNDKIVYANLTNELGQYLISKPVVTIEDPESPGEYIEKLVAVGPALTPLKYFLWDFCDKTQWDSLFIDGEYPEETDDKGVVIRAARSKNSIQEAIKSASNYIGSPIYELLAQGGDELEIADAEKPVRAEAKPETAQPSPEVDPLEGI